MNVSEIKQEIESDKAFIEKVSDRIYKDTDDWEETIPEPEWIDRMTEIADRYLNRFELAQKLADKWIQSKSPQLNENQQIAINNAKKSFEKGSDLYDCAIDMMLYDGLTDKEWAKATVVFLLWAQEQEEE